jgi:hypothetical protein
MALVHKRLLEENAALHDKLRDAVVSAGELAEEVRTPPALSPTEAPLLANCHRCNTQRCTLHIAIAEAHAHWLVCATHHRVR